MRFFPTPIASAIALSAAGLGLASATAPAADLTSATTPVASTPAATTPAVAPPALTTTMLGTLELPDDLKNYSDLGAIFSRQPLAGADGNPFWLFNRQLGPDDAKALGVATADLSGKPTLTFDSIGRTVALRRSASYDGPGALSAGVSAYDGGTWVTDDPLTPRPARAALIEIDDRAERVDRITMRKGVTLIDAIPTSRGLRLVGLERRKSGRRTETWPVVIDGKRFTRFTRQKYIANVTSVAPLPDGSLLLTGNSAAQGPSLPTPVLRISPSGKVARMADRRARDASLFTGGAVATSAGVAMIEGTTDSRFGGNSEAEQRKSAVVLRGATGKVIARANVTDFAFPRGACLDKAFVRFVGGVQVGPDGLPMVRIACSSESISQYGYPVRFDRTVVQLGLSAELKARWSRTSDESLAAGSSEYAMARSCESTTTDAAGRLLNIGCDGTVRATTIPGALPVARGTVVSRKRDGKSGAVVRIRCRGEYGATCNGLARITANGEVIGSARYSLPARPEKAGAVLDRHIPTTRALPARFTATLGL